MPTQNNIQSINANTRLPVYCNCGQKIFDGEMIKVRIINLSNGTAMCRHCKSWVRIPVAYQPIT